MYIIHVTFIAVSNLTIDLILESDLIFLVLKDDAVRISLVPIDDVLTKQVMSNPASNSYLSH